MIKSSQTVMASTPFWREPWFQEVLRQVFIALLLALLSVLGYDLSVARPRQQAVVQSAVLAATEAVAECACGQYGPGGGVPG